MNKKLAIVGAGGHGKVVGEIATLSKYKIIDFFDDKVDKKKRYPFNIAGTINFLKKHLEDYDDFFVSIGDNQIRCEKIEWLKRKKKNLIKKYNLAIYASGVSNSQSKEKAFFLKEKYMLLSYKKKIK